MTAKSQEDEKKRSLISEQTTDDVTPDNRKSDVTAPAAGDGVSYSFENENMHSGDERDVSEDDVSSDEGEQTDDEASSDSEEGSIIIPHSLVLLTNFIGTCILLSFPCITFPYDSAT